VIADLRDLAEKHKTPLAILQDLSGPKIRLGNIAAGTVTLKRGQPIVFTTRDVPGDEKAVSLPVPEFVTALRPGCGLFADDGRMQLVVVDASKTDVTSRALVTGVLSSHKGIMAPGVSLNIPAVTSKDENDLRFGLAHGVDWVAASYIRGAEDI